MSNTKRKRGAKESDLSNVKRKRIKEPDRRNIVARSEETINSQHKVMHNSGTDGDGNGGGDEFDNEYDRLNANRHCGSCNTRFASPEAYKFHREVKMLNKTTKFLPEHKVTKNHTMVCSHLTCCFSTDKKTVLKVGNIISTLV